MTIQASELVATTSTTSASLKGTEVTESYRRTLNLSDSYKYSSLLRTVEDVTLAANSKGRGLLLSFDKHTKDTRATLEITPSPAFLSKYPELTMLESQYHSAMNLHAFAHVSNPSSLTITIPKGTVVASARIAETGRQKLHSVSSPQPTSSIFSVSVTPDTSLPFDKGGPPTTR